MDSFIFIDKGPGKKRITPHKVLDLHECDEDSTIDYKALVSQPKKDSIYYSKIEEEKIVEE